MKCTVQEVAGSNLSQMTSNYGGKFVISLKPSKSECEGHHTVGRGFESQPDDRSYGGKLMISLNASGRDCEGHHTVGRGFESQPDDQ